MRTRRPKGGPGVKIVFPERWGFCENDITDKHERKSEQHQIQKQNKEARQ